MDGEARRLERSDDAGAVARGGGLIVIALLGWVLSQQGEALVAAYHGASLAGSGLALASALIAFATLDDKLKR